MGEGLVDRYRRQRIPGPTAKRPTRRGEHETGKLAPAVRLRAGPQALMDRTVLGIDGHQFGPRRGAQRLHHRPGGDETLLVGEGEPLAGPQRLQRHRQTGEPDDAVDHDVGIGHQLGEIADHAGKGQGVGHVGPLRRIAHRDDGGAQLAGLGDHRVDRCPDAEPDDAVAVRLGPHDIDRLCADRPRRTGDRHVDRALRRAGGCHHH